MILGNDFRIYGWKVKKMNDSVYFFWTRKYLENVKRHWQRYIYICL